MAMRKRQLSKREVDELYKQEPRLNNPNYPKRIIKVYSNDNVDLKIRVKGTQYLVKSNPNTGIDKWYY